MKNRKFFSFVILSAAAVILIAAYFLSVNNLSPGKTGVLFVPGKNEELTAVRIKNTNGDLSFYQKDGEWKVSDGNREFYTNSDKMKLLTNGILHFPVLRVFDTELDEYGTKSPRAAVTYETNTGRQGTIVIGAQSANTNEYYALSSETDGVLLTDGSCVNQLLGSLAAYRTNDVFVVDLHKLSSVEYHLGDEKQLTVERDVSSGDWSVTFPFLSGARNLEMNEFVAGLTAWSIAAYPDEFIPAFSSAESLILTDSDGISQRIEFGYSTGTQIYARIDGHDDVVTLYDTDIDLSVLTPDSLIYENPLYYPLKDAGEVDMTIRGKSLHFDIDNEAQTVSANGTFIDYDDFTGIYFRYVLLLADGYDASPAEGESVASFKTTLSDGTEHSLELTVRDSGTYYMEYSGKKGFYLNSVRLDNLLEKIAQAEGVDKPDI